MPSEDDNAARIMALFSGNEDFCGTHGPPDWDEEKDKWSIQRTARTLADRTTIAHWQQHLVGARPLGVAPTRRDSSCLWGSIDVDDYEVDAMAVCSKVASAKLPLIACRSKSGGLHLFLFLSAPEPARAAQTALRDAAAVLGLSESEIYPKQAELRTERGDQPNWMVMPYFGALGPPGAGTMGGKLREQWGVKPGGGEMTLSEFLRTAEGARCALKDIKPPRPRRASQTNGSTAATPFADGPPCLQHLAATGIPRGGQNNALIMMGIYYKKAYPDEWRTKLTEANATFLNPPGSEEGLKSAIASLEKRDYNYTCKKEPMVGHCNVAICRGREHGVGEEGQHPLITSISRYDTDPPLWFVDVEGHRVVATTEQLQNYPLFHRLCMERASRVYAAMRQADWLQVLRDAMTGMTPIPAPPDVGEGGRFLEMLTEFLTNRTRAQRKEDLLSGRPWESLEDGRHYFSLTPFMQHMRREGERDVRRSSVTQRVEGLGGGHVFWNIQGKGINLWWVPGDAIVGTPAIPVPEVKEGPI